MTLPSITLWVSARDDCDNGLQCGDFIDEEIFQIVLQLSWKKLQNNVNQRLCDTFFIHFNDQYKQGFTRRTSVLRETFFLYSSLLLEALNRKDFLFICDECTTCAPKPHVISVSKYMKDGFKSTAAVQKSWAAKLI